MNRNKVTHREVKETAYRAQKKDDMKPGRRVRKNLAMLMMSFIAIPSFSAVGEEIEPAQGTMQSFSEALKNGKPIFNARLRYEYANIESLDEANALTIRPRFGYETGSFNNFKALIEGEHTSSIIPDHNYSAPGQVVPGKSVIADPEGSEINQAYLSYSNYDSVVKLGRQRIILDNARFIGNVGWRQAEQTYDAISLSNNSIDDLQLSYAYISQVNRIFYTAWDSDSHVLNISYSGLPDMKIGAYSYLLSFDSSPVNGSDTFGLYVDGSLPTTENFTISYHAEYAFQEEGSESPLDYSANYYHLNLGGTYKKFSFGGGYEVLGSDGGTTAFRTPLATLHAFNGWADAFLATPANGLQDAYGFIGYKFGNVPVKAFYHHFSSDEGSMDYGNEVDLVATYKLNSNWSALAKYAYFTGSSGMRDIQRFWLQLDWKL